MRVVRGSGDLERQSQGERLGSLLSCCMMLPWVGDSLWYSGFRTDNGFRAPSNNPTWTSAINIPNGTTDTSLCSKCWCRVTDVGLHGPPWACVCAHSCISL